MVRLERALYGHKHSGVYWQRYCHEQCINAGFRTVSENWPSVYFNDATGMLLVVYDDDMKLSGPANKMKGAWEKLGRKIKLEVPKGDEADSDEHTFLGCRHKRVKKIVNGHEIMCVEYDVCASMRRAVDKYRETVKLITGLEPELPPVETPFLAEETRGSELRKPKTTGDFIECPSCLHTIPKSEATVYPAGTDRKLKKIWEHKLITPSQAPNDGEQSDQESVGSTCTGDGLSSVADSGSEWEYSLAIGA